MWTLHEIQILVSINKLSLEHGYTPLHFVYGCFHTRKAELNSWKRDYGSQSQKYFFFLPLLFGSLQEKFAALRLKVK